VCHAWLRKAAARLLAKAGCTPHQIMAITGHKTLVEVGRYTRAAAQKKFAASAMDLMPVRLKPVASPNLPGGLRKSSEKLNEIRIEKWQWRSLREGDDVDDSSG
jgi:hypothetical protein